MRKLTKIAAAVGSVVLMGYGASAQAIPFVPNAAYAESELLVSGFRIQNSSGTLDVGDFTTISGLVSSQAPTASINNSTTVQGLAKNFDPIADPTGSFTTTSSTGAYVPYASYTTGTIGAGTFAGATSFHSGSGLQAPGTVAQTQAQVNINGVAVGAANAAQTLNTEFTFTTQAPDVYSVSFNAELFQRVALAQADINADSVVNWGLTVFKKNAAGTYVKVLQWNPDGEATTAALGSCYTGSALTGCIEQADPFSLNATLGTLSLDDQTNSGNGIFAISTALNEGAYKFTIGHTTFVNAETKELPEPASLALLGLSFAGLGFMRRRKAKTS